MKADHEKKDELKKQKDKEKLLEKIRAMKAEEEQEKEIIEEHQKTKIVTKMIERTEEDEELVFDSDEEQMMRKYRRKEDGIADEEDGDGHVFRSVFEKYLKTLYFHRNLVTSSGDHQLLRRREQIQEQARLRRAERRGRWKIRF